MYIYDKYDNHLLGEVALDLVEGEDEVHDEAGGEEGEGLEKLRCFSSCTETETKHLQPRRDEKNHEI